MQTEDQLSPPNHVQFIVDKQGSILSGSWAPRVLTVDAEHFCLFLSRKDHADQYSHHSMRVHRVTVWPDIGEGVIHELPESTAAKLTFCVTGPASERVEKPAHGPHTASSAHGDGGDRMSTGTFIEHGEKTWVLRCSTGRQLEQVVGTIYELCAARNAHHAAQALTPVKGVEKSLYHSGEGTASTSAKAQNTGNV